MAITPRTAKSKKTVKTKRGGTIKNFSKKRPKDATFKSKKTKGISAKKGKAGGDLSKKFAKGSPMSKKKMWTTDAPSKKTLKDSSKKFAMGSPMSKKEIWTTDAPSKKTLKGSSKKMAMGGIVRRNYFKTIGSTTTQIFRTAKQQLKMTIERNKARRKTAVCACCVVFACCLLIMFGTALVTAYVDENREQESMEIDMKTFKKTTKVEDLEDLTVYVSPRTKATLEPTRNTTDDEEYVDDKPSSEDKDLENAAVQDLTKLCKQHFGDCYYHSSKYAASCAEISCRSSEVKLEPKYTLKFGYVSVRMHISPAPSIKKLPIDQTITIDGFLPCLNQAMPGLCYKFNNTCLNLPKNKNLKDYDISKPIDGGWSHVTQGGDGCIKNIDNEYKQQLAKVGVNRDCGSKPCGYTAYRSCINPRPSRGGRLCWNETADKFLSPWTPLVVKNQCQSDCDFFKFKGKLNTIWHEECERRVMYHYADASYTNNFHPCTTVLPITDRSTEVKAYCVEGACVASELTNRSTF